jgi:hypothetical protein
MMTEGLQHVARLHRTKVLLVVSTLVQHNATSHHPSQSTLFPHLAVCDPITVLRAAQYPALVHVRYDNCFTLHWPNLTAPVVGGTISCFVSTYPLAAGNPTLRPKASIRSDCWDWSKKYYMVSSRRGRPYLTH